jgi:phospholipid-binding lipoprotein MlaA
MKLRVLSHLFFIFLATGIFAETGAKTPEKTVNLEKIKIPKGHIGLIIDAAPIDENKPPVGNLQLEPIRDPAEPFNRVIFAVNDKIYLYGISPVGKIYRKVFPKFFRKRIHNFGKNLGYPVHLLNSVLQLKIKKSGIETSRFLINSTIGILGLFDPATKLGIKEPSHEDFGQTLAAYNIPHGIYIVAPIIGPTSLRDGVGFLADTLVNFLTFGPVASEAEMIATSAAVNIDDGINMVREYRAISDDQFDKYSKIRDLYLRLREGESLD